jgi:hypothetical protein
MRRSEPGDFGVVMDKEEFRQRMLSEFDGQFKGKMSLDELLLRPRVALWFCDFVREKNRWWDLPDDVILRSIMAARKNPALKSGV